MKKGICLILSLILLLGVFSGCSDEAQMKSAVKSLSEYTPAARADLISLALPMLLTDSGLALATNLIIDYNPQSDSLYNTLLHPVFKVIDQKTAQTAIEQLYKIDESLRSKYFEGFQKRVTRKLTAQTEASLTRLMQHEYEKYPGLEKICREDGITAPVLAHFLGLPVELNGGAALLTDANATDFKAGKVSALLEDIFISMSENQIGAKQSIEKLATELNTTYSATEKQQLKNALREIGLYEPSGSNTGSESSGGVTGGATSDQPPVVQGGFAYKISQSDSALDATIEVAYFENDKPVEGKELTEPFRFAIPVNTANVMLYYEDASSAPVKYTAYADGMLYCCVEKVGTYKLSDVEPYFADANGWGKDYIEALFRRGIISGKSEGVFAPEAQITREEFVKLAVELFDLTDKSLTSDFADVPADAWHAPYIASAKKHGIVSGISATQFGVGMPITRQDMCKILYGMLVKMDLAKGVEAKELVFHDAQQIASYAQEAVSTLVSLGIINGDDQGNFNPQNNATRQEAAKLIYGMLALYVR